MKVSFTKRWVLYALVVWLGGLGCLAGCFAQTYAAPAHAEHAQTAQADESDCTDGCCKEKSKPSGRESDEKPKDMADCCIYSAMPPATLAKKSAVATPQPSLAVQAATTLVSRAAASVDRSFDPPLLDFSGTYLRIRLLRI